MVVVDCKDRPPLRARPAVSDCPYTRGSRIVLVLLPEHVALICGAMGERREWVALIEGERRAGGSITRATGLVVPEQERSASSVSFDHASFEEVVGVVHLHPGILGAFFSLTDRGEGGVNEAGCSLVVAPLNGSESSEERALGFRYRLEGKFSLPCGRKGRAEGSVVVAGFERLFKVSEPLVSHEGDRGGDCPDSSFDVSAIEGLEHTFSAAECGLRLVQRPTAIWGKDPGMLREIERKTRVAPNPYGLGEWLLEEDEEDC